jgi:hypothetical protein
MKHRVRGRDFQNTIGSNSTSEGRESNSRPSDQLPVGIGLHTRMMTFSEYAAWSRGLSRGTGCPGGHSSFPTRPAQTGQSSPVRMEGNQNSPPVSVRSVGRLRRVPGPAGPRIGIHPNRPGVESRRDPQQGDGECNRDGRPGATALSCGTGGESLMEFLQPPFITFVGRSNGGDVLISDHALRADRFFGPRRDRLVTSQ